MQAFLKKIHRPELFIAFFAACFAAVLLAYVTSQGIGLAPDSREYVRSAQLLLADPVGGLRSPEIHNNFPMGYAALLAAVMGPDGEDLSGVRWLHIVLIFAATMLFGHVLWRFCEGDLTLLVSGLGFLTLSWPLLAIFSKALSELPYIVTLLGALASFLEFERTEKWRWMLAFGALLGMGVVLRYAGLYMLVIMLAYATWRALVAGKQVISKLVSAALITLVLPALQFLRNQLVLGGATNREALINTFTIEKLKLLPGESLFVPLNEGLPWIGALFNLLALAAILWMVWQLFRDNSWNTPFGRSYLLILISGLAYVGMIIATITFFDPSTPINARMLVPARVLLCIPMLVASRRALPLGPKGSWLLIAIVAALLAWHATEFVPEVAKAASEGRGYSSSEWRNHPYVALAKQMTDKNIYTNGRDVLDLLGGDIQVTSLPFARDRITFKDKPEYAAEMEKMCDEVRAGKAVIIYFEKFTWRTYLPKVKEIQRACPGISEQTSKDGVIFGQ